MKESLTKLSSVIEPALLDTIYLVGLTLLFSIIIGFILAILLYISRPKGLKPMPILYHLVSLVINIIRSLPFMILSITMLPLTRFIAGEVVGNRAALIPLIISASSLMTRLIESAFCEVDPELIKAIQSFGATKIEIIHEVVIIESIPSIISHITLTSIIILSMTAISGSLGAGGLGMVAINYGYNSYDDFIMYSTVVILIIVVQIMQYIGSKSYESRLK